MNSSTVHVLYTAPHTLNDVRSRLGRLQEFWGRVLAITRVATLNGVATPEVQLCDVTLQQKAMVLGVCLCSYTLFL